MAESLDRHEPLFPKSTHARRQKVMRLNRNRTSIVLPYKLHHHTLHREVGFVPAPHVGLSCMIHDAIGMERGITAFDVMLDVLYRVRDKGQTYSDDADAMLGSLALQREIITPVYGAYIRMTGEPQPSPEFEASAGQECADEVLDLRVQPAAIEVARLILPSELMLDKF